MDRLEQLYEDFMDRIINDYPLTTNRISDYDDALNINRQIINRISNIRRYLVDAERVEREEYIERTGAFTDDVDRRGDAFTDDVDGDGGREGYIEYTSQYLQDEYDMQQDIYENTLNEIHNENNINFDLTETNNYIIDRLFNYVVNTTFSNFTYTDLNELNDVKITLTKEQFDKFEKGNVSESDKLSNCSICMDNYELDKMIVKLKCNHIYHENCIENWLCNQKVTCPICRKDTREML